MRILWIDDDYDPQKEPDWFGNILEQHEVQAITDFEEAYHNISNQLEQYDIIVIDINLFKEGCESELVKTHAKQFDLSPKEYLEEGGFHLYLELLAQGFDQKRIVFLTGNVDTEDDTAQLIQEMKTAITTKDRDRYKVCHQKLRTKMSPEEQQSFDALIREGKSEPIFIFLHQWHQERKAATAGKVADEIKTVITDSPLAEDKKETLFAFLEESKKHVELLGNDIRNIYNRFNKRFREARLIAPKAIKKSPVEVGAELQQWLRQFCERREDNALLYDYLVLRRGILNVLDDIETNHYPLTAPFADEADPVNAATFLKGIQLILKKAFSKPSEEEQGYLFLTLCDYLTKHFERFSKELFNGWFKGQRLDEMKLDKAFIIPTYFIRNWIAHGLLNHSQSLSAQDIGFLFILVIRSMFNLPCLDAFKSLYSIPTLKAQDFIRQLSELHEYYSYPKECDIFEVIRAKGAYAST